MDDPASDPMAPPAEPCECFCLHCRRTFMSDRIWFQEVIGDPSGFAGFWLCPTPNCSGCGFGFDIFPTDPSHPANGGWCDDDDDEYDEDFQADAAEPVDADYDPQEPAYRSIDEELGDPDDDILEGDEWKLGPDHAAAQGDDDDWQTQAARDQEERDRLYDQPDQRPRTLDWSHQYDRHLGPFTDGHDDDIPF